MIESMVPLFTRFTLLKLPYLFVYTIGIIIVLLFIKNNKKTSIFACAAFLLFIFVRLFEIFGKYWSWRNLDSANLIELIKVFDIIGVMLDIVAWSMLIIAIYCSRQQATILKMEP